MTKRHVTLPDSAEAGLRAFVEEVDERLSGPEDDYAVVEDVLVDLNGDRDIYERWQNDDPISNGDRLRLQSYDPHNATLESEYYAEKDEAKFAESKPIHWLWRQFDHTPAADNIAFALRFRQMLAHHLFEEAGDNLRIFKGVTFTYGHNVTVGDNTVIHDGVHIDDRGRVDVGARASISDGVHIYSHDHDLVDQTEVENYHTVVEDDARVTFDAMLRAGVKVGENAVVGARAIVQQDVPAHHVVVGAPAKSVRVKPGWEDVAAPLDDTGTADREARRIDYELADDLDVFDEFERDLTPPN